MCQRVINEMTVQVRVSDFTKGVEWYKTLLKKGPDFIPHEGFALSGNYFRNVGYKFQ